MKNNKIYNRLLVVVLIATVAILPACSESGNTPEAKYYHAGIAASEYLYENYRDLLEFESYAVYQVQKMSILAGDEPNNYQATSDINFQNRLDQLALLNNYFNKMFQAQSLTQTKKSVAAIQIAENVLEALKQNPELDSIEINKIIHSLGDKKVDFKIIGQDIIRYFNQLLKADNLKYQKFAQASTQAYKNKISKFSLDALDINHIRKEINEPVTNDDMVLKMYKLKLQNEATKWNMNLQLQLNDMDFVLDKMLFVAESFNQQGVNRTTILKNIELINQKIEPDPVTNKE